MEHEINKKYKNITRDVIMLYLNNCESCKKKGSTAKKGLVVKPIISSEMNSRCQIDLIGMQAQSDVDYKFILVYHYHLTKYIMQIICINTSQFTLPNIPRTLYTMPGHCVQCPGIVYIARIFHFARNIYISNISNKL